MSSMKDFITTINGYKVTLKLRTIIYVYKICCNNKIKFRNRGDRGVAKLFYILRGSCQEER